MIPILQILTANRAIIKVAIVLTVVVATYVCGYIHRGWKEDAKKAEELGQAIKARQHLEIEKYTAERKLEAQLNVVADNAVKLNNEVENEAKKPINTKCKFSPDGVRIINAAARNKPAI